MTINTGAQRILPFVCAPLLRALRGRQFGEQDPRVMVAPDTGSSLSFTILSFTIGSPQETSPDNRITRTHRDCAIKAFDVKRAHRLAQVARR